MRIQTYENFFFSDVQQVIAHMGWEDPDRSDWNPNPEVRRRLAHKARPRQIPTRAPGATCSEAS